MFCGECGTQNPDTNQFCKNCGKPLRKPQQAPAAQPSAVPARPVAAQPPVQQPAYYPPQPAVVLPQGAVEGVPSKPPLNKGMLFLGIVGIIFGIVSWFFYPYLCGFAAVLLGGITFYKTENKMGIAAIIAIIALVIGIASMVVGHFYLVVFPPTMGFEVMHWLVM